MENKKADKNKKQIPREIQETDRQHRQVVGGWLNGWLAD